MASITRAGKRWRAQVFVRGVRSSKIHDTKAQASAWALAQQAELGGDKLPDKTFGQALQRYADEVAPLHRGETWEVRRLTAMGRHKLADKRLAMIVGADIASWRDDRLKSVAPASVLREMKLMRSVFESCRRDFGWLRANPMQDVTRPTAPASRKRRIKPDEIERLRLAFGLGERLAAETATQRAGLAFLLGLETAMRAGEMLGIRPGDVELEARYVRLPRTKNGDAREVALSSTAVEILTLLMAAGNDPVFALEETSRDALFRKIRKRAALDDLHFHDSRAEAIWRLSKKLDVLQLARMIGHRDLKSLMIYYDESASELAKRLA
jgi:integrase